MYVQKALFGLVLAAGLVVAQGPGGFGRGPGRGPGTGDRLGTALENATFDQLKAYLTLTDAQVTQLKSVIEARANAAKPVLEQIREKQKALNEEMKKDSPSAITVGQLMVDIKNLREQIRPSNGANADALAVLNDAQKAKLKDLEAAQALMPAVRQAELTGLIARPEPVAGSGVNVMGRRQGVRMQRRALL